jgi:subtilase family serine protease
MRVYWNVTLCICLSLANCDCMPAHGQAADSTIGSIASASVAPDGAPQVPSQIVARIDEAQLARLEGNTHPMARPEFDEGPVDPQLPMERMILVLKRSPDSEAALETFMAQQLDSASPDFHHWLKPGELGKLYGPSANDISTVANWLQNHGFSIDSVAKGRTFIEFSGTARLVREAFHTEIHRYRVNGEEHIANNSDPSIPEALSPVVVGVFSLHNFFGKPMHRNLGSFHRVSKTGKWAPANPNILLKPMFGVESGAIELVSPYDFATIYNVIPLWTAGIDGTGQTIAIAGRSDINLSDVATFRSAFGLPVNAPTVIVNGPDPGVPSADDKVENTLDVEWSGAVAKGAIIKFVTTASTMTTDGAVESALYIIENNIAPIMSFSYGNCELAYGTAGNAAFSSMWQEGAAGGITEFVASGDQGSAACDGGQPSPYLPQYGLAVSGPSSTPWDVAVGGTDFQWANLSGTRYWSSTDNSTNLSSALGYIPEVPWNGTCASNNLRELLQFTAAGVGAEQTCNEIWDAKGFFYGELINASGGTGGVSNCTTNNTTSTTTTPDPASCSGGVLETQLANRNRRSRGWQAGRA